MREELRQEFSRALEDNKNEIIKTNDDFANYQNKIQNHIYEWCSQQVEELGTYGKLIELKDKKPLMTIYCNNEDRKSGNQKMTKQQIEEAPLYYREIIRLEQYIR